MSSEGSQGDLCVVEEDMYVVEKVIRKKSFTYEGRTQTYYEVKWQGYPDDQNSWEPEEHLSYCPQVIQLFEKKRAEKKKKQTESQHNPKRQEPKKETMQDKGKSNAISRRVAPDPVEVEGRPRKLVKKHTPVDNSKEKEKDSPTKVRMQKEKQILPKPKKDKEDLQITQDQSQTNRRYQDILKSYLPSGNHQQQKIQLYGRTLNHIYDHGKLYYQVQRLSKGKSVSKIDKLSGQQVQKQCLNSTYKYLQSLLTKLEKESIRN